MDVDRSKRARAQPREEITDKSWGRLTMKVLIFLYQAVNAFTFSRKLLMQVAVAGLEEPDLSSPQRPTNRSAKSSSSSASWEEITEPRRNKPSSKATSSRASTSEAWTENIEEPPPRRNMRKEKPPSSSADESAPTCHCKLPSKLFTARTEGPNWMRRFWRCPKSRETQCEFFAWLKEGLPEEVRHAQEARENHFKAKKTYGRTGAAEATVRPPRVDEEKDLEEIQRTFQKMCKHPKTSKAGSNFFLKIVKCTECGLILQREKTEDTKNIETKQDQNYQDKKKKENKDEVRKRFAAIRKLVEGSSEEEEPPARSRR
jgi:hypothetical protein